MVATRAQGSAAIDTPRVRRYRKAFPFFLLLIPVFLVLCFLPGHAATVDAQSWSSSILTVTDGSQAGVTPTLTPAPQATPTSVQVTPTATKFNASNALTRIFQLDTAQYTSSDDENAWGMSACSSAAITEVLNAYGFNFRIADVLHVQAQLGAITVADGLTTEAGIEATAARFGFQTSWGHSLSLDQVIATANSGRPVIVSFPPGAAAPWITGHILVVRGGDASSVKIVDSSMLNKTILSRQVFASYWRGASWVLSPPRGDMLAGKPTISVALINKVLAHYNSPAAGQGQALYDLGVKYDIDPTYALAFFFHESQFGTTGMARITHSLGNSRCVQDAACINSNGGVCEPGQSCYAGFDTWGAGFDRWYRQMIDYENGALKYYLSQQWIPLTTLQVIIPVYAPSSDNNDVGAYIGAIQTAVKTWRSSQVVVP